MALQDKKIMSPPWLAHPDIERHSIGWRMGHGEDYMNQFGIWLKSLPLEEQAEYRALFPEPVTWRGWWGNEETGQMLEHGDFWVEQWQPDGQPKYTRQWLQKEIADGKNMISICSGGISPPRMEASLRVVSASGGWLIFGQWPTPIAAWNST